LQIIYNPTFIDHFSDIWGYIAKDSRPSADRFRDGMEAKLKTLVNFPYKFRKSFYYNDENIRDYIFKGYTISYFIDMEKEQIVILDIFKWINR
jgi:plasmid stabilization system protein ParE